MPTVQLCRHGMPSPCPLGFPGCHCADDAFDAMTDEDFAGLTEDAPSGLEPS